MSLKKFILTRLFLTPFMVLILLTLVFFILRILPGDPVRVAVGPKLPPEYVKKICHELGLDKPIIVQYFDYLWSLLHGDFGKSLITRRSFANELIDRFKASVELAIASIIVAIPLGLFIGDVSAKYEGSPLAHLARLFTVATYSIPVFWLGIIFQVVFGIWLGILPITGGPPPMVKYSVRAITGFTTLDCLLNGDFIGFAECIRHLILPAVTLGVVISGIIGKVSRNALVEVMHLDYVTAAKARGLPEKIIHDKYIFRNALIPIITIIGLQLALLLGGAILTETTFDYPGLGTYLKDAVLSRDYTVVQAAVTLYAIMVAVISFIVDIIYAFLDPRIRY